MNGCIFQNDQVECILFDDESNPLDNPPGCDSLGNCRAGEESELMCYDCDEFIEDIV